MLKISAPEIQARRVHGMHIDVGDTELANLGIVARNHVVGTVDNDHSASRTNCLRCRQRSGSGPAGHVQNLVARRGIEVLHQPIRAKGRKAHGFALRSAGNGVQQHISTQRFQRCRAQIYCPYTKISVSRRLYYHPADRLKIRARNTIPAVCRADKTNHRYCPDR